MKKFILSVSIMVIGLMGVATVCPVFAADNPEYEFVPIVQAMAVTPRWSSTTLVVPSISNNGSRISASLLITPKTSSMRSSGTLYLEKYTGKSWTTVASWPIDATGTVDITKSYKGSAKNKYRTRVVVKTGQDEIKTTSNELSL